MTGRILVTFASRTGTTKSIAEAISQTLTQSGLLVDVLPVQDVKDISVYRAVVVGSAIQKSKWLPEATQFLKDHRAEFSRKPLATFTVCITLAMSNTEQYQAAVAGWTQSVRDLVKPVKEGFFAGLVDTSKLSWGIDGLLLRAAVTFGIFPHGDKRDWNAIRTWAESLPQVLIK